MSKQEYGANICVTVGCSVISGLDALCTACEIEALKAEVIHQKERKASIGNEVDKWRNRAVASLSRAEKAEVEVYKIRGELVTTRAENLELTIELNKFYTKNSTLHFNHKEG